MNKNKHTVEQFIRRMKSIGFDLNCSMNYPWIYIDSINGIRVTEKRYSEHGYTVGLGTDENFFLKGLKETFELLRKYKK